MKKGYVFLLALILVAAFVLPSMATAVEAPSRAFGINWTQVVVWLIGAAATALSALLARIWTGYVRPWLEQKELLDAAEIVVNAVEAILGRYGGEDKWHQALEKMQARGFDVDSEAVIDALKAAWADMNMNQIMVGMKEPIEIKG